MHENFTQLLEQLHRFNLQIRHDRDTAEAVIPEINAQIERLYNSHLASRLVLLGDVLLQRPYEARHGAEDSGQVVLAVLQVPGGITCCFFDSEELHQLQKRQGAVEEAVAIHAIPFANLDPHSKGRLLGQVEPLVERFVQAMRLR
jgi:hypothetical protein